MYRSEAASPERWQAAASDQHKYRPELNNHNSDGWTSAENGQQAATDSNAINTPFQPAAMSRRTSRGFKRGESLIEDDRRRDWDRFPQQEPRHLQQQKPGITDEERLAKTSVAQSLVLSLLENTGAHGIPNIKRAPNNVRKVFWTILFFFGLGMFIWQTSWLLERYYAFGVDVKMEISSDRMVEFPAVTICNLNPIKSDFWEELDERGIPIPPSLTRPNTGYGPDDSEEEFDDAFEMLGDAIELVTAFKYKDRRTAGHLLRDMLVRCVFQGRPCHARDFTYFFHYLYGNCYIFNAGPEPNATTPRLFVTKAGPLYGLTLELYIEQDQYIEDIQPAAGARVVVHARHNMPFPDDEGVSVSPGQETFIGFKRTNFTRLPHPYSNCTVVENANATIFNLPLPHVRYSQRACENNCYYQNLTRVCGCADVRFRYDDNVPLCLNSTQEQCLEGVERMYLAGMLDCMCSPPCRELQYDIVTGQARWPNEKFKLFLDDNIGNFSDDLYQDIDSGGDPDFLEKNLLKVNVYYDKLEYTTIYQDVAYDHIALLSDMGGNVGLWIGVSVLTVFEFIELLYDLGKLIFYRVINKNATRKTGKVTSSDVDLQHVSNLKIASEA
ncbi:amiloride-sensitive sodium channel subunit alpha-like [Acanthaster planci]|uniref:Amiloride-sensitive sodium channel subunit alpha-like n=1 Tax=Acanthaster planci TaxID=133434 RepID=A0A8B8A0E1_ACAPL|nr:amiloride-sensitive sodium channel subunit alpha-like [Acanthaster planci]